MGVLDWIGLEIEGVVMVVVSEIGVWSSFDGTRVYVRTEKKIEDIGFTLGEVRVEDVGKITISFTETDTSKVIINSEHC